MQLAWVVDIDEEKAQRIAKEQGCRWSTQVGGVIKCLKPGNPRLAGLSLQGL